MLHCRDDIFAQDSIELLKTSGIDFEKFDKFGIDVQYFGELMMMSGLVLNDEIKWISFHSKYDFGYLLKTLTCTELPMDEQGFLDLLFTYFPCIYDVKVCAGCACARVALERSLTRLCNDVCST